MAAMAGALDTTLTKRDHYTLGDGARAADAAMVGEARVIARAAALSAGRCADDIVCVGYALQSRAYPNKLELRETV